MEHQQESDLETRMVARLNVRFLILFVSFILMGLLAWFALWVWV